MSSKKNKLYDGEFFCVDRIVGANFVIICQICSKELRTAVNSTANIWKHVDRFHSAIKQKIKEKTKAASKKTPSQAPAPKRRKTIDQPLIKQHNVSAILDISSAGGGSGGGTSACECGPLSIVFEKVQESTALHTKYNKELTHLYGKVSSLN